MFFYHIRRRLSRRWAKVLPRRRSVRERGNGRVVCRHTPSGMTASAAR